MYRWNDLTHVPEGFGPSVVTLGNFDGVHRGHQGVLKRMVNDARAAGQKAVVLTFDPHPATVHRPAEMPELITGLADRLELLEATGLDAVLVQPYSLVWARQSPEEFVRTYLVEGLHAVTVVVGHDVRFGWQNAGDLTTMIELGEKYGFAVEVMPDLAPASQRGEQRRWSSTWVREALNAGDVAAAAEVLGRPHRMRGLVVRGDARGRELGVPTANLAADSTGIVPADGVYAGWLTALDEDRRRRLPAAISVGTNPTFDGVVRRVEAHVLDRDDLELYDREVMLEFVERLRPTLKFDSIDELVAAMADDVERTRKALSS